VSVPRAEHRDGEGGGGEGRVGGQRLASLSLNQERHDGGANRWRWLAHLSPRD
jgi:hypothetical protein